MVVGAVLFCDPKNGWEKSEKEWGTRRDVRRPCLCAFVCEVCCPVVLAVVVVGMLGFLWLLRTKP